MDKTFIYPFLICVGLCLGLLLGIAAMRGAAGIDRPTEIERDTVWIRDTITKDNPVPVPHYIRTVDSIPYPVYIKEPGDTIHATDTLIVYLEREQVKYEDEDYAAWVSGVQPKLDSIQIYRKTEVITVTKKNRWSLGIQSGAGFTAGGFQPYIGVGISYSLISF